ncbi:MAG: hypothetical protein ACR2QG_00170 [Gammaproteobacteria bacterium]
MNTRLIILGLLSTSVLLAGCESAFFGNRQIESTRVLPIENEDALFTAVTVKSERRMLIIDENDKTVCSEPMAEARDAYSSDFADQIGKAVRKGKVDGDVAMAMVSMYDEAVDGMIVSQGIKFSRDHMYQLCVARQNGFINNADYQAAFKEILNQSARLIALEIPTMRNANVEEMVRLRDYLTTALETGNELAEAMAEQAEKGVIVGSPGGADED